MDSQNKVFGIAIAVVTLAVVALLLQPKVREQLAPEPVAAWVAIEVAERGIAERGIAERGIAEVAPVELEVGTPFRLHAVLEARGRGDRRIFYTEAPRLRLGGEEVPAEALRSWDERSKLARVRWFTVEGERPWIELDAETGIQGFKLREFLRSDWPIAWSIPGEIDAAFDNHLAEDSALEEQLFGTQRYQVRIELYRFEDDLIPERVIRSWGIDDLKAHADDFPTVEVVLPGAAAPASRVFGLSQLDPPEGASGALLGQIEELAEHHLAFSRRTVLRDHLRAASATLGELEWRSVDLRGELPWSEAAAGDLLRVGDRVVVLFQDRGEAGVVDYGDLCMDFVRGASVRALEDVFARDGEAVEWAAITRR